MRDYARIGPQFWIGKTGKELRKRGPECQVVAMYLISSPHSNMLGLFYLPKMFIAHETGLPIEGASKGLQSAIDAGFCAYDEDTEMVWVFEMAKYQIGDALKPADKRCQGVQNEYNSIPDNPFLSMFYEKYCTAFCMSNCRGKQPNLPRGLEGASKPHRSQEQEQEQDQDIALSKTRDENFEIPITPESEPIRFDDEDEPTPLAADSCTGENLQFNDQHLLLARTTGLGSDYSDDEVRNIFELFRCYKSNANTLKSQADWLANWRTWCQREKVRHAKQSQPNPAASHGNGAAKPRGESATQRAMRLAEEASNRLASRNTTGQGN
jgi:hypothetical protein